jgi:chromosome segregation ATPase
METFRKRYVIGGLVAATNADILMQLRALSSEVKEISTQGRETGQQLALLRRELGLDGPHGRLPQVEIEIPRINRRLDDILKAVEELQKGDYQNKGKNLDVRLEKMETTLDELKESRQQSKGRRELMSAVTGFIGGAGGAAIITILANLLAKHSGVGH